MRFERLKNFSPKENEMKGSCVDKTEAKIYIVIEWIPFISTIWDLFPSITYAAAGCESVTQERAISLTLDVVTDIGTAITFGAVSAPLQALRTEVKIGVKFGIKAGLKGTVNVAKTSLQAALKKTVSLGLKSGTKKGVTKAGKFIAKEVVVDPPPFLKKVGKLSKQISLLPKATSNSLIRATTKRVESLKKLKNKL